MTTFAYNRQQSELLFDEHGALNVIDFIHYAATYLEEAGEGISENACQCQSEINMYGDSGPGTMLRLGEQIAEFNRIADRYTALTGAVVQRPRMPYHPVSDDFDTGDWNSY